MSTTYQTISLWNNNIVDLIQQCAQISDSNVEGISVDMSDYSSARPHTMAALTAFFGNNAHLDCEVVTPRDQSVHNYMTRMKFYEINEFEVEYPFAQYPAAGRFIELSHFNLQNQDDIINEVTGCLQRLGVRNNMQRALAFTFTELIDNACNHSEANNGGVICAQFFPNSGELHVAIADCGIGIPGSLSEHPNCLGLEDHHILGMSVQKNVSSKLDDTKRAHQGMGLYCINTIAQMCGGELNIYSKSGLLKTENGNTSTTALPNNWPGTIIHVVLPNVPESRWEEIFEVVFPDGPPIVKHLDPDDFF